MTPHQGHSVVVERSGPLGTQMQCFVEDDEGVRICTLPITGYSLDQRATGAGDGSVSLTPGRLQIRD